MSTWRDRADQNSIADFVSSYALIEFFNYSNRLMSNHESRLHRIFAAKNVQIGPANGRQCDSNDRFASAGVRTSDVFNADLVRSVKHIRAHRFAICLQTWPVGRFWNVWFENCFHVGLDSEFEFGFAQLFENNVEIGGRYWLRDAGGRALGVSERGAMARFTRGHDHDRQIVATGTKRAKQRDRVTITAIDHGKIEFGGALAANLESTIDIVSNYSFGTGLFESFGYGLFEIGIMSEQESEANFHCLSFSPT